MLDNVKINYNPSDNNFDFFDFVRYNNVKDESIFLIDDNTIDDFFNQYNNSEIKNCVTDAWYDEYIKIKNMSIRERNYMYYLFIKQYIYTTAIYKILGMYKIGETSLLCVNDRITQQDKESSAEELLLVDYYIVPRINREGKRVSDRTIRKLLINKYNATECRNDKKREWLKTTIPHYVMAINEVVYGISRPDSFSLREEQQKCVNKICKAFKLKNTSALINAKPGFGKTLVSCTIAKELDVKNLLIATWKPDVDESFREIIEDHVAFDGWVYHKNGNGVNTSKNGKVNVYFTSFQDAMDLSKEKWENLHDIHFELIIIDESHYGSDTEKSKEFISKISHDKELYVSGTPTKAIMSGMFNEEQIFNYTYIDEQNNKRKEELEGGGEIYKWLPTMNFMTFKVDDDVKNKIIEYYPDGEFSMTKMFKANENGFVDHASVKLFIEKVFGLTGKRTESPIRQTAADHILMYMPKSVKSVKAMCELLETLVGDSYTILNASGDNIADIDKLKSQIKNSQKSITVSCGRFNTGVTVGEWEMVMMLNDGKSVDDYFQTIFRAQRPNKKGNKLNCYVVDYNPDRALVMLYNYNAIITKKDESSTENLEKFLECMSFMDFSENKLRNVSIEDIFYVISKNGENVKNFTNDSIFNMSCVSSELSDILKDISFEKNKFTIEINNNGVVKTTKNSNNKSFSDKDVDKPNIINNIIERAKTITQQIPNLLAHIKGKDTYDLIKNSKRHPIFFKHVCNISIEDFEFMISTGFIKTSVLDKFIHTFNTQLELI